MHIDWSWYDEIVNGEDPMERLIELESDFYFYDEDETIDENLQFIRYVFLIT